MNDISQCISKLVEIDEVLSTSPEWREEHRELHEAILQLKALEAIEKCKRTRWEHLKSIDALLRAIDIVIFFIGH